MTGAAEQAGPTVGGIADDDSVGFAALERTTVRAQHLDSFEWVGFPSPSPRHRLRVPLTRARVGLVATAGAHRPEDRPIGAGGGVREIPAGAAITLTHHGYDTERALQDPEVVYPDRLLAELATDGVVGAAAATVLSTMGGGLIGQRYLDRGVPGAVAWAREHAIDLAVLVPA